MSSPRQTASSRHDAARQDTISVQLEEIIPNKRRMDTEPASKPVCLPHSQHAALMQTSHRVIVGETQRLITGPLRKRFR